jgi:hypothetical protein
MKGQVQRVCVECDRAFNISVDDDLTEWLYGHDCEAIQ